MRQYTIVSVVNDVVFYLTETNLATDIPEHAATWYDEQEAVDMANEQNTEKAWTDWGIHWNINMEV